MKTFNILQFNGPRQEDKPSAWEIWRHTNIDAEDAAALSDENPWEDRGTLMARKAKPEPERKATTPAMELGRALRPAALAAYRTATGIQTLRPTNVSNIAHPWMIAHPDLMDANSYHLAEVHSGESALRKAQATGKIPKPYWAQAQHTLMATGFKFLNIYFHSPTASLPGKTMKVWASEKFQEELLAKEISFLRDLTHARQAAIEKIAGQSEAKALEATIAAILGKGPKVPIETFRRFVPKFLTRRGAPTQDGLILLATI